MVCFAPPAAGLICMGKANGRLALGFLPQLLVVTDHLSFLAPLATGMARANLNKWVAAAAVIQRNVRSWLFRRRMQEWFSSRTAAAVVLQSCWRGRQARAQLEQLSHHCIFIQVSCRTQSLGPQSTAGANSAQNVLSGPYRFLSTVTVPVVVGCLLLWVKSW